MSARPALVKQNDLARILKAHVAAGIVVVRTEIGRDGKIVVITASDKQPEESGWGDVQ